ncbi:Lanosterol 14-alpha-demethylase, partial [Coemansia sp. RSA 1933]
MAFLQALVDSYWSVMAASPLGSVATTVLVLVLTVLGWAQVEQRLNHNASEPPVVPYYVPFIGSMVSFGMHPIKFIRKYQKQYGNFFTFLMFGRRMTVCVDIDGNDFVFNV